MKMTKKILALILCAVMVLGILAGCGKNDNQTDSDSKPVYDPAPIGKLILACSATVQITYDGGGLVQKLEGLDDNGAKVVAQYTDNSCYGATCSVLVADLILKCHTDAYINSDHPNIIIKQVHGSAVAGTNFLEGIVKDAEEVNPTDAPVLLIKAEDLDENGYIGAAAAKNILQATLGLNSPDKISAIGELEDDAYPFAATVGGRRNTYSVHAVTGQVTGVVVQEPNYEDYYNPDQDPTVDEPIIEFVPEY